MDVCVDLSNEKQMREICARLKKERLTLLDHITRLAQSVGYSVFQEYTCERAGHFYNSCIQPRFKRFHRGDDKEFPFTAFAKKPIEDPVQFYRQEIERLFTRAADLLPLEQIKDEEQLQNFVLCSQANVVFITASQLLVEQHRLKQQSSFGFTTLVAFNAHTISDVDFLIAASCMQ